ncbi:DUF4333 domain-containing protein [Curtobacterium sp. MCBA15_008]|uniref:DUF4333 domain-containing protein n=1 Tax=Curtobacterium sp. MCBA15_008 TaxID=1898736 RepID=UPI0009F17F1D|nr:DUF4333 domain-containing protein [Curtobacterium sp. MCBA15_008]
MTTNEGTMAMTRSSRRMLATGMIGAAVALAASGCSFSASVHSTVSPSKFETVVADALEKSVGQRPQVDCGDDAIDLEDGNTVHCDIGAAGDATKFDATVEVRDVSGSKYSVHVEVADEPKN